MNVNSKVETKRNHNNRFTWFLFALGIMLLIGCEEEHVYVVVNKSYCDQNEIFIDEQIFICPKSLNDYVKVKLKKGKHIVQINGSNPKEFNVIGRNGILNLKKEAFVKIPIYYQEEKSLNDQSRMIIPIISDSIITYDKSFNS